MRPEALSRQAPACLVYVQATYVPLRARPIDQARIRSGLMRVVAQPVVEDDDVQNVEQLAFILVYALDLAIEDRIWVDLVPAPAAQPVGEAQLGGALGLAEGTDKGRVVGTGQEPLELGQIDHLPLANGLGDQPGQIRIGQQ
jgi:hypothetical protein